MISQQPAVLPHLEHMFGAAAAARIDRSAVVRRTPNIRAGIPRIAAVALVGAVFAGTAGAATGLWNPPIGDQSKHGSPTLTASPVPARVAQSLGVLEGVPSARDRSPEVEETLHHLGSNLIRGVRPESIRFLAAGVGGQAAILVSAEEAETPDSEVEAGEPSGWSSGDPLCLIQPTAPGGSVADCYHLDSILADRAFSINDGPSTYAISGLVPDRVVAAEVELANGTDGAVHRVVRRVEVANNYFHFDFGAYRDPVVPNLGFRRISFFDAQGRVVHRSD